MKKILNRNDIKIIALITMVLDHIGCLIEGVAPIWIYYILRTIGRISFPLFCYFVAEGYYYTKNKSKYLILLLIFAIISTIPHSLLFECSITNFNILFTFIISILFMMAYDHFYKGQTNFNKFSTIFIMIIISMFIYLIQYIGVSFSYGLYGIFLPYIFYVYRESPALKYIMFTTLLLLNGIIQTTIIFSTVENATINTVMFEIISLFALTSIPIMMMYNGEKGKYNLKYLFYISYPAHMLVLYLIKIIFM